MILLITKADLPDYTKFSVNTADLLINPSISDAHTFDVGPHLSLVELRALAAYLADADRADFATTYTQAETAGFPEADLALLQLSPLYALHMLFTTAVRPLLCYEAYRRFLLDHGVHVTPRGVEVVAGDGTPVSGQQRTEMRADAQAKCSHYQAVLANALRTYRGPATTSTTCGAGRIRRPSSGGYRSAAI
jgi:hypothetical protein